MAFALAPFATLVALRALVACDTSNTDCIYTQTCVPEEPLDASDGAAPEAGDAALPDAALPDAGLPDAASLDGVAPDDAPSDAPLG